MTRQPAGTLLLAAILLATGCATRQVVPVECVTHSIEVWVDGRMIDANPDLLRLSTDEPHKVLVKAAGFEPQLYVFEPEMGPDGKPRLSPGNLCVELVPRGQGRQLQIEIDDPPGS